MSEIQKHVLQIVENIKSDIPVNHVPPSIGKKPYSEMVLDSSFVKDTRGYIEKIVQQINGCYENGWNDACAVMIRRVLETLIIESFEKHKIDGKIKNTNGNFFFLSELINYTLNESSWNVSRNSKSALKKLKDVGDLSAHSRRYVAHRSDIDSIIHDFRIVVQELLFLSGLK
jgi:hypothetical protein